MASSTHLLATSAFDASNPWNIFFKNCRELTTHILPDHPEVFDAQFKVHLKHHGPQTSIGTTVSNKDQPISESDTVTAATIAEMEHEQNRTERVDEDPLTKARLPAGRTGVPPEDHASVTISTLETPAAAQRDPGVPPEARQLTSGARQEKKREIARASKPMPPDLTGLNESMKWWCPRNLRGGPCPGRKKCSQGGYVRLCWTWERYDRSGMVRFEEHLRDPKCNVPIELHVKPTCEHLANGTRCIQHEGRHWGTNGLYYDCAFGHDFPEERMRIEATLALHEEYFGHKKPTGDIKKR